MEHWQKNNTNSMKHTHISARHRLFHLNMNEVWQYRELIILFAKRSFQVSYKQTILGPLWLLLNPLLTAVFDVILFGNIAKLSTDGVPQLLFYLSGHALWNFFSGRVSSNANTFTGNSDLFGKVYFPRLVIPIADVLSGIVRLGIQMLIVIALYIYYAVKGMVQPNVLLLLSIPFILMELGLMGMGIGVIISSLTTKYRDLSVLVGFALQLWMYATPVVYPMSSVSGTLKMFLLLNPVTAPTELFRCAMFDSGMVTMGGLLYSLFFTFTVVILGVVIFNKVERTFIDTV